MRRDPLGSRGTAVDAAPGARIVTAATSGRSVDTELFFPENDRWSLVFRTAELGDGTLSISTRGTALARPVMRAFLSHVTAALDAIVIGQGGEEYDPST